jgi:outer membrane biosynthesis protein TonB
MRSVFSDLKTRWLLSAPNPERQSVPPSDETAISFTIASDGKVSAMHLDHATNNAAQDKAAWGAISSAHYPPLPPELKDSFLKLRVLFPAR